MASHVQPKIYAFKADAAIAKGKAVKVGSDDDHVLAGAANTDSCIGLAQNAASAAEDIVEVALLDGAKGLLGETVVAGDLLVSHTDGSLVKANALGDELIAKALQGGVSGDLVSVLIVHGHAARAE